MYADARYLSITEQLDVTSVLIEMHDVFMDRDAQLVLDLGLDLKYVVNTHVHADHVTGRPRYSHRFNHTVTDDCADVRIGFTEEKVPICLVCDI